jgi:hypothetical protein
MSSDPNAWLRDERAWAGDQSLWPPHLRDGAPYQICSGCERRTWAGIDFYGFCTVTQPSGLPCGGRFGPQTFHDDKA